MLKFLAILFIVGYVTYKFGGFLMKMLYTAMGEDPSQKNFNNESKRRPGSNVDVDYVPKKKGGKSDFQGGEYVDYEDLK